MRTKLFNLKSIILAVTIGIIFTSCTKDSDPAKDILGTWTVESVSFSAMVGTQSLFDYLIDEVGLSQAQAQAMIDLFGLEMQQEFTGTIEMKSDNTYTADLGGEDDSGTWSLISDNTKLVIDSDYDDPMTLDILEITSSKLRVQGDYFIEEDLDDDEIAETITITIDLNFRKL